MTTRTKHIARGYTDRKQYESFRGGGDGDTLQVSSSSRQGAEMLIVPKPANKAELDNIRNEVTDQLNDWDKSTS